MDKPNLDSNKTTVIKSEDLYLFGNRKTDVTFRLALAELKWAKRKYLRDLIICPLCGITLKGVEYKWDAETETFEWDSTLFHTVEHHNIKIPESFEKALMTTLKDWSK